jgi:hypothetical protein
MDRSQAVQAGMAAGTDGDEEPRLADTRAAMVDMEGAGVRCPTALASIVVAVEDRFPISAEVIARVPAHAIALRAEAGDDGDAFAAGAKQRLLLGTGFYPGPQDAFLTAGEG